MKIWSTKEMTWALKVPDISVRIARSTGLRDRREEIFELGCVARGFPFDAPNSAPVQGASSAWGSRMGLFNQILRTLSLRTRGSAACRLYSRSINRIASIACLDLRREMCTSENSGESPSYSHGSVNDLLLGFEFAPIPLLLAWGCAFDLSDRIP